MLNEEKKQKLEQIIKSFSNEEIIWTSGYLAGLNFKIESENFVKKTENKVQDLTIIYVSETGNSKFLAEEIAKNLKNQNTKIKLKSVESYRLSDLEKERNLILISSTHGEGEIPENGKKLYEFLLNQKANYLENLSFITIALGDSSYPLFCEAGKIFTKALTNLSAKELIKTIELDVNFEEQISDINKQISITFGDNNNSSLAQNNIKTAKKQNYLGEIVANINLNDIGSTKKTHHIEIAVNDEIHYEEGDAVAILLDKNDLKIEENPTPRLYSIASSLANNNNEVHLTVGVASYKDNKGNVVEGLFSSYLSKLKIGDKVKFSISPNRQFKLPKEENKDIIMVGAGTGIAPFRSFLAKRNEQENSGKNWLFFGERNFRSDFLYQTEWQDYLSLGVLNKIDVAFSRDQKEKIYVSHKILEQGEELFLWLENGAYFYVCGDKENMAKDVENALLEVIRSWSKVNPNQYLTKLIEEGRYLRDVY